MHKECFNRRWRDLLRQHTLTFYYFTPHRGTKDFIIETSYDEVTWEKVLGDSLESAFGFDVCQIPTIEYQIQAHARYLRYTLVNYHGTKSAALNYIGWEYVVL